MNKTINDKLRSRKGASITFALLLFLVCAVLCSVTITAATTVSGRLANMAQADQRYYSVTSACEVLKSLINKKTVTIVTVTTREKKEDGTTIGSTSSQKYLLEDMEGGQAAARYGDSNKIDNVGHSIVKDAASSYGRAVSGHSISITGLPNGASEPVITEDIDIHGNITLNVSQENVGNPFAMQMKFKADVSEGSSTRDESEDKKADDGSAVIKETKIDTLTIRWTLSSIKTVSLSGAGA